MPDHDKLCAWENFARGRLTLYLRDIIPTFYWVSRKALDFFPPYFQRVRRMILQANDDRVRHQLFQMEQYLQNFKDLCDRVVREHETTMFDKPCRCSSNSYQCREWRFELQRLSRNLFRSFMRRSVSQLYYVWKLRLFSVHLPPPPPLDDLSIWEIICEDEEVQVLSHPLLPHPTDFLHKRKKELGGGRYVDKAQFGCYIPGTLAVHNVVFTKKPSAFPRLSSPLYREDFVCRSNTPTPPPPFHAQSSTNSHKGGKKKRRKALSRVWKETHKKRKPVHRVWKLHELTPEEEEDEEDEEMCWSYYSRW